MNGWITVARADNVVEADLLRARLESSGLNVLVRDEHVIRMDPIRSNAWGGLRIDVWTEDADVALEILGDMGVFAESTTTARSCAACRSTDVRVVTRDRMGRLLAALITVIAGSGGAPRTVATGIRCRSCGHTDALEPDREPNNAPR